MRQKWWENNLWGSSGEAPVILLPGQWAWWSSYDVCVGGKKLTVSSFLVFLIFIPMLLAYAWLERRRAQGWILWIVLACWGAIYMGSEEIARSQPLSRVLTVAGVTALAVLFATMIAIGPRERLPIRRYRTDGERRPPAY